MAAPASRKVMIIQGEMLIKTHGARSRLSDIPALTLVL